MSIVTSVIFQQKALGEAGTLIVERHTDSAGGSHDITYVAAPSADTNALLALHATQLADDLAEAEAFEVLG